MIKPLDWFAGNRDARKGEYNPPANAERRAAYDAGYDAAAAKAYANAAFA